MHWQCQEYIKDIAIFSLSDLHIPFITKKMENGIVGNLGSVDYNILDTFSVVFICLL